MDNDTSDTSWCPVCDRQIQPKRFLVPITQPQPQPQPMPQPTKRQSRLRHNATIRATRQQPPVKHKLVIDQGPTPLYCSDQCQVADINRGLPDDFHPHRQPRPVSPLSFSSGTHTDSASSCSSVDSQSSSDSSSVSPSLARLAKIYNFPPFPPPAPVPDQDAEESIASYADYQYSSGVMMAARRIASELTPAPPKRDNYGRAIREPRKPIPGWTDGSNAWRSSIYSLSAAKSEQKSLTARSSIGVHSTATAPRPSGRCSTSLPKDSESDSEMLHKFSQSFTRCASRVSIATSSALRSSSSTTSFPPSPVPKRERPLISRGAEGKLLVPEIMKRVNSSASTTSLSSQWSATSSTKGFSSPLSHHSSLSEDDSTDRCDSPSTSPKRPTVEMRSWSYDNVKTYPIMQLPPKTKLEKRKEIRVVDGKTVEVEVEVEVEVVEKLKRLFLFEPKTVRA